MVVVLFLFPEFACLSRPHRSSRSVQFSSLSSILWVVRLRTGCAGLFADGPCSFLLLLAILQISGGLLRVLKLCARAHSVAGFLALTLPRHPVKEELREVLPIPVETKRIFSDATYATYHHFGLVYVLCIHNPAYTVIRTPV